MPRYVHVNGPQGMQEATSLRKVNMLILNLYSDLRHELETDTCQRALAGPARRHRALLRCK